MPIHRRDRGRTARLRATVGRTRRCSHAHERGGYGSFTSGGRCDQPRCFRSVRGAGSRTQAAPRPGCVVMDNLTAHKGERVRELIEGRESASCSTCRPTRQTSIRSKKPSPKSRECYGRPRLAPARRSGGGDGYSDLCSQCARCARLLRALRLPSTSSITMTSAVGGRVNSPFLKMRGASAGKIRLTLGRNQRKESQRSR
jgi:hypothetical protein